MSSNTFIQNKYRDIITTEELESFKKFKQFHNETKIIGTHSGKFHADEVLSTFLLKYYPDTIKSVVVRTRNDEILKLCDMVVDVGSIIDPKKFRFDHHMKEFK